MLAATVAVFVRVPLCNGVVTTIVIAGADATASVARVQVTVPAAWLQVHPEPVALP